MFDLVSGYKHVEGPPDPKMSLAELRKAGYLLSDKAWLNVTIPFELHRILPDALSRGFYFWKV